MPRRWKSCFVLVPVLVALLAAGCSDDDPRVMLAAVRVTTPEEVPVEIHVLQGASYPDGAVLRLTSASPPGPEVEILNADTIRFTPAADFNGVIQLGYRVSDGGELTASGVAFVTVLPVNDAPVAHPQTLDVHGTADITLRGKDADGDALNFAILVPPSHGTLTGTPPTVHYAAVDDFKEGDDQFTFQVSDGQLTGAAVVQLHVTSAPGPTALSSAVSGFEEQLIGIELIAFPVSGGVLQYRIEAMPQHGTLSGTAPNLFYQPVVDFNGDDELRFSVSDGVRRSEIATLTIHVMPLNDAPVAVSQTVETTEDTPIDISLDGSDVDGDFLTFQQSGLALHGTVTFTGAIARFTPSPNFSGTASFNFVAFDRSALSAPATVTIHVAPVNDPPVAAALAPSLNEDTPGTLTLSGSDPDGDPLQFALVDLPQHGALTGSPPQLTYTPAANYNGPDSFTYTATDGTLTSAPATVSITVKPVNDPPVATSTTVTTDEDTPVTVTLQATDIDSPSLSFSITAAPSDGSFTLTGADLTYTPALNATGQRMFTFKASDGPASASATVTINITPINDPPIAADDYVATDPGAPLTIDVVANDVDPEGDAFQIDAFDQPAHGTVDQVGGKLVYTPSTDEAFTGIDVFHYTVSDVHGAASTAQVHVGVGEFPPGAPAESLLRIAVDPGDRDDAPSLSGDGRYVAFSSFQPLTDDDHNGAGDVYVYDRGIRKLTRVSVASDGTEGNGTSMHPQISGNGRYVVFESSATNLVSDDGNGVGDVFRHDLQTGATIRISVATGGGEANGPSSHPVISDDGQSIAYTSNAFNLVSGDANGASDVFLCDLAHGPILTTRVSVSVAGGDGDFASSQPAISGDGRVISFTSSATNMIIGDTNNASDVFVRDRSSGGTLLASASTAGQLGDRFSNSSAISRDGRFVSFVSQATNLVQPPPTVLNEAYVRDVTGRVTTRPSAASVSVIWGRLSGDGRYLAQQVAAGVQIIDRFTPITTMLHDSTWHWPVVSSNGRYIAVLDTTGGAVSLTVAPNPL
jgi:Tol biopolymer transport system component